MKYTENALNILTAKSFKGIGDAWINKNLANSFPYEAIVEMLKRSTKEKIDEQIFLDTRKFIENKILKLSDCCDGIVALGDSKFPNYRGNVKESDRPNVLFYKGNLSLLDKENHNIAVIGLLTPDPETEKDERKVVKSLIENGATIVSGLALGCDTIAHHQTLQSKGFTVAILPSPLNNIIPAYNRSFAIDIIESEGLLISEYFDEPRNKMELSSRYIRRDRLQALFSDLVILTASYAPNSYDPTSTKLDSGSRHAMGKASEYGLDRGVIYNKYNDGNPKYDLNRQIIKESPSPIIIDPQNIEATLSLIFKRDKKTSLPNRETQGDLFSM